MYRLGSKALGALVLLVLTMATQPDSVHALPPVQGEVVSVTVGVPGTMVVRDEKGQMHILNLTQQTQLGARFKPGDKVVAFFSPYGVSAVQLQMGSR
jgi:Spy/CpxP family protein refolding chaperone